MLIATLTWWCWLVCIWIQIPHYYDLIVDEIEIIP